MEREQPLIGQRKRSAFSLASRLKKKGIEGSNTYMRMAYPRETDAVSGGGNEGGPRLLR